MFGAGGPDNGGKRWELVATRQLGELDKNTTVAPSRPSRIILGYFTPGHVGSVVTASTLFLLLSKVCVSDCLDPSHRYCHRKRCRLVFDAVQGGELT